MARYLQYSQYKASIQHNTSSRNQATLIKTLITDSKLDCRTIPQACFHIFFWQPKILPKPTYHCFPAVTVSIC